MVTSDWRDLPRHRDEDQVKLDVNRSFIYYPTSKCNGSLLRSRRLTIPQIRRRYNSTVEKSSSLISLRRFFGVIQCFAISKVIMTLCKSSFLFWALVMLDLPSLICLSYG